VLIPQKYPGVDDERHHFEVVLPALHDPRYWRIDDCPLFLVLKPENLPDPHGFTDRWRTLAREAGLPGLFLVGLSAGDVHPTRMGFDGAVASRLVPPFRARLRADPGANRRVDWVLSAVSRRMPGVPPVYPYAKWSRYVPDLLDDGDASFPAVLPGWDNTPRRGRFGLVFYGETPELFEAQVRRAAGLARQRQRDRALLFVRSWNEWAEGNYMEPDRKWGRAFLQAFCRGIGT
jgi:hypothetical protein